jgi:hypothetical protein
MPDEFPDQVVTHGVDQVPLFQVTEPEQQVGHLQRHGGLPGARIPGKAHVQVGSGGVEAEPVPDPVDQQQRGDLLDLLLHRDQADQLVVQGGEHVLDVRRLPLLGEGDGLLGVQDLGATAGAGLDPGFPAAGFPAAGFPFAPLRPGARRPGRQGTNVLGLLPRVAPEQV